MIVREMTVENESEAQSFEDVYQRLEDAAGRLEAGGLNLEESIALYETGMRLAQRCKQMLSSAELRVRELQKEFAGDSFDEDEDNEDEDGDGEG